MAKVKGMANHHSNLISDLRRINENVSCKLCNMSDVKSKPSESASRLIFPQYHNGTWEGELRISEQEARFLYAAELQHSPYYYSVETPTKQSYCFTANSTNTRSARIDLTIYKVDNQSFIPAVNVEFKGRDVTKNDVGKDIYKLVREQLVGNLFHTLIQSERRDFFPKLFEKYRYAFLGFIEKHKLPEKLNSEKISILFCICAQNKKKAYIRHFFYEPSKHPYEEYVGNFFDSWLAEL